MATAQLGNLMRHIQGLAAGPGGQHRTDRQLLDDFASGRDEHAFAALVGRHGPLVLRVCRRVLRHEQDAEDAFQATFLILAKDPGSIHKRESLGSWLYGVAYRTAMAAKRKAGRRRNHEARLQASRTDLKSVPPTWDDVQVVLDEEIQRLPESFRTAFVLCVLEGKTVVAAAAEVVVKEGTLSWRLTRARQRLRKQLAARGIELSAVLAALSVAQEAGRAAVPAALAGATVRLGLSVAAGGSSAAAIPSHVAALAAGVTRAMFLTKTKTAVVLLLALGLIAAGAGGLACRTLAARDPETKPAASSGPAASGEGKGKAAPAATGKQGVTLTGRVLNPEGQPAAGARLYLLGVGGKARAATEVKATADRDGRFRLTGAVEESYLVAVADGYGPAWTHDLKNPEGLTLRLVADDVPITGRILDLQGRPVPGVTLKPTALKASPTGKLDAWLEAAKVRKDGMRLEYEKLSDQGWLWENALARLFPRITTDGEGRFQLKGIGRERVVALIVEGPAVQTQEINVATRTGLAPFPLPWWGDSPVPDRDQLRYYGAHFEHVSPPCRPVSGVVRDRATGKPIAGAVVRAEETVGNPFYVVQTITDSDGRYRLTGLGKGREGQAVSVLALGPDNRPYLGMKKHTGGAGLEPATLDFPLKKGLWVEGQVTDRATGRGVQSGMMYYVFRDSLEAREDQELFIPFQGGDPYDCDKQGHFRFVAYPGRGLLGARANGPEREHYRISLGAAQIKGGEKFGSILRFPTIPHSASAWDADAWKEINPAPGREAVTCPFALDPGRTLRVHVEAPDGKPLEGASIHGQFARLMWSGAMPAAFSVHGLEEGKGRTLLFRHVAKGLAALREIKADESGPVEVRLQSAGSIRGRLVNDDGRPWRHTEMPVRFMLAEQDGWVFEHSREKVRTDAEGRFRIDGLVPGMKYHALIMDGQYPREVFTDLTLTSGQAKDLGDVTPKKARDAE
jgi:RNA polymerase sigma factor (sigma-70 family)